MSDISLINTANYRCYYSIDGTADFKLYTPTPSGNIEYVEYDTFTSLDKTIIAFKELDPYSGDFNYVLVRDNEESIIDAICYDDILEHLVKDSLKEQDMYCVMSSKVMTPATTNKDAVDFVHRCDAGKYGPVQFPLEDGVRPTVTDTELPSVKLISVIAVKICFDVIVGDDGLFVEVWSPSTSKGIPLLIAKK